MAYQAISATLRSDVQHKIRTMAAAERGAVQPVPQIKLTGDEPWLVGFIWREYPEWAGKLPADWCSTCNSFRLEIHYKHTGPDGTERNRETSVHIALPKKLLAPPNSYIHRIEVKEDVDPQFPPFIEYTKQQLVIQERWNTIQNQVMTFLNNCKSLNEALKLWPDVRYYIPQQYIDKVETKVVKGPKEASASNAEEILKSMDTDHLVSSAVIARMAGAQHE